MASTSLCRVCHCEAEEDRPLFYPCNCSGSIKFIHEDCLVEWLRVSKKETCELCGQQFKFNKVYAPNAPAALSTYELLKEVFPNAWTLVADNSGMLARLVLWFFLIPCAVCMVCSYVLHTTMPHSSLTLHQMIAKIEVLSLHNLIRFWFSGVMYMCSIVVISFVISLAYLVICAVSTFKLSKT